MIASLVKTNLTRNYNYITFFWKKNSCASEHCLQVVVVHRHRHPYFFNFFFAYDSKFFTKKEKRKKSEKNPQN
jgi:hypothetical protein